jgi:hypothetical protein
MSLTIRPDPDFNKHLKCLKNILKIKTSSGIIKFVVKTYEKKDKQLQLTKKELSKTTQQLNALKAILNKKKAIEKELSHFVNNNI